MGLLILRIAAAVEALSLVVLLANLLTVHAEAVSRIVGPLHGMSYVTVIAAASMTAGTVGVRWRAVIPGFGGLLALRQLRSTPTGTV